MKLKSIQFKKVYIILLIIILVLPFVNYYLYDLVSLTGCNYKSFGSQNYILKGSYDLFHVAESARSNGIDAEVRYLSGGGIQVNLTATNNGAEYTTVLRYKDIKNKIVEVVFLNIRENTACKIPNYLIRNFISDIFKKSNLEYSWVWDESIHRVIYWGPGI